MTAETTTASPSDLGTIDTHLERLSYELKCARNEKEYALQASLVEQIDVLLDRRIRSCGTG